MWLCTKKQEEELKRLSDAWCVLQLHHIVDVSLLKKTYKDIFINLYFFFFLLYHALVTRLLTTCDMKPTDCFTSQTHETGNAQTEAQHNICWKGHSCKT